MRKPGLTGYQKHSMKQICQNLPSEVLTQASGGIEPPYLVGRVLIAHMTQLSFADEYMASLSARQI